VGVLADGAETEAVDEMDRAKVVLREICDRRDAESADGTPAAEDEEARAGDESGLAAARTGLEACKEGTEAVATERAWLAVDLASALATMLDDDGVGSLILARMEWEWVMGAG
jgi:hypothetical protein